VCTQHLPAGPGGWRCCALTRCGLPGVDHVILVRLPFPGIHDGRLPGPRQRDAALDGRRCHRVQGAARLPPPHTPHTPPPFPVSGIGRRDVGLQGCKAANNWTDFLAATTLTTDIHRTSALLQVPAFSAKCWNTSVPYNNWCAERVCVRVSLKLRRHWAMNSCSAGCPRRPLNPATPCPVAAGPLVTVLPAPGLAWWTGPCSTPAG
jgi:hypothetical protein